MRLQGKAAVITGAASGFGAGMARAFAAEGASVWLVDRDPRGEEVAAAIRAGGGRCGFSQADVSAEPEVVAAFRAAVSAFGGLDIVCNNAGIPQAATPLEATDLAVFERLFAVNVRGVFLGCRTAIPLLRARGGGAILNTASTAAIRPRPGLAAYNATKAAVVSLTRTLALEAAPHRIRVNCVCPVAGDTPMLAGFFAPGRDPEEARAAFVATIPLGRLSTPADVAAAAVYLCSDEAALVTGVALEVDGGRDV
jgi:3-oxoacyl-[acyl-carrier protein] reductase